MSDKTEAKTNKKETRREGYYTALYALLLIFCCLITQWAYKYYQDNPLKFPWGSKVYTVSASELNLLPNEQANYLGTRLDEDDETDFLYHADNRYMFAASAFSIRTGPGVYYQSIGRMYYGREVHIIATCEDNDWYLIDFYGEEAYVHSACLFDELPELEEEDPADMSIQGTRSDEPAEELDEDEAAATEVTELVEEVEVAEEDAEEASVEATPTPTPTPTSAPTATPAPTAAPSVNAPSDPTMLELFNLVNQARAENGLAPLSWNSALASDAAVRAQEIVVNFSHTRPDGSDWWTVDPDRMYGENLASGQSTAQEVFNSWWASPGHRANILGNYTTCGFALYYGGDAGSTYYWVQEFGY